MRRFLPLIFIWLSLPCFSQDFLHSDDYIYGMGRGDTVFAADSSAMLSLSMSLRTGVVNTSSHMIEKEGGKITSVFKKNVSLDSSIDLPDTRNYVTRAGDEYIVYRYLNKKEYIDSHISQYLSYMAMADSVRGSNVKHEKNLLLGCYYLAYKAIDTPIMDLYTDTESNKIDIARRAREVYHSGDYGFLMFVGKKWNGYEVSMGGQVDRFGDTEPIELIGFEYVNDGKWLNPVGLSVKRNFDVGMSDDPNTNVRYRRGLVETDSPHVFYRILYEKYEDGRYVKIQVPDEWYFSLMDIRNPMFLS